jgi:hypothetical protein
VGGWVGVEGCKTDEGDGKLWANGADRPVSRNKFSNGRSKIIAGTRFLVHKDITSAVTTVEFISGRRWYITITDRSCDINVLNSGEDCIMKVFITCTFHQISLRSAMNEDEMVGDCSTHGTDEKCIQYFGGKT